MRKIRIIGILTLFSGSVFASPCSILTPSNQVVKCTLHPLDPSCHPKSATQNVACISKPHPNSDGTNTYNVKYNGRVTGTKTITTINPSVWKTSQNNQIKNTKDIKQLKHSKSSKLHEDIQDARLAHLRNHAHTNEKNILKNSTRPDQIKSGSISGGTLTITEIDSTGKNINTAKINMDSLITKQGTQNSERADQISKGTASDKTITITETSRNGDYSHTTKIDTSDLTTKQGDKNTIVSAQNKETINHNSGGLVDGKIIRSNKQLSFENNKQWQSIKFNEQSISYEHNWNIDQQKDIDSLKNRADRFQNDILNLSNDLHNYGEYMVDSAAGSAAIATIDFGSVKEDELEIGVGVGMSGGHSIDENSFAAGVGLKYGIDDTTSGIAKGWISQHGNYGAGAGVVFKY